MADGSVGAIPGWTGAQEGAADWNTCILGDAIVPGIVSIRGLKVGIDIDTKKARGAECPTSTDNGLRPSRFSLVVWLKESQWPEFQTAAQSFQPRRPGRERQPLQIIHPLVNFLGITEVRVAEIEADSPTARHGLVFQIHLEEWFDKPKAVKKNDKPVPADPVPPANALATDDAARHALNLTRKSALRDMSDEDIDPTTFKPLKPTDNASDFLFGLSNANPAGGS